MSIWRTTACLGVMIALSGPALALNITDVRDMGWTHVNRGDEASPNFKSEGAPTLWDTSTITPSGDNKSAVFRTNQELQWREYNDLSSAAAGATLFMVWQPNALLYPEGGPTAPTFRYNLLEFHAGGVYLTLVGCSNADNTTTVWLWNRTQKNTVGSPATLTTGNWYQWWIQADTSQKVKIYDTTNAASGGDAIILWDTTLPSDDTAHQLTMGVQKAGVGLVTDIAVDELYFQNSFRNVPEPTTVLLVALAGGLAVLRRRR